MYKNYIGGLKRAFVINRKGKRYRRLQKGSLTKSFLNIENLKLLSKLLNISIDYLLDDGDTLDMTVIKKRD